MPGQTLTVTRNGTGTGTVTSSPAGISCGNTCSMGFTTGSQLTLTATPDQGSSFTGWGGACTGTGTCQLTMGQPQAVTATFARPCSAFSSRRLPQAYLGGQPLQVTILASPPVATTTYALEDLPPSGWVVSTIDSGGALDPSTGKVKWGPFFDPNTRTVHYVVIPSSGTTETKTFTGSISIDGVTGAICGDTSIPVGSFHPADVNTDLRIVVDEVTAYGLAWKTGGPWPNPPIPIPIDYVTNAGLIWKSGEAYHLDMTLSPPWAPGRNPGTRAPLAGLDREVGTATRSRVRARFGEAVVGIQVAVKPGVGAHAFALEETIPAGWSVRASDSEGVFDLATRKLRWGPFLDASPRTFTYALTRTAGSSEPLRFFGTVSIDGTSFEVGGVLAIPKPDTGPRSEDAPNVHP